MENNTNSSKNYISYAIFSIGCFATYILLYNFALQYIMADCSDLGAHMTFVQGFIDNGFTGFVKSWTRVPYCVWHLLIIACNQLLRLPIEVSGAFVFAAFGVFAYIVTTYLIYKVICFYSLKSELVFSSIGSFLVGSVGPLYTYWCLPSGKYLGQFSPNPYHNPTHMAVKGIGMICVMLGIDIFRKYRNERPMFFTSPRIQKNLMLWFAVALFLSTITKPTFMYMLLPSGFIYILVDLITSIIKRNDDKKVILKNIGILCVTVLPSMAFLILEYIAFFKWSDKYYASHVVIGKPLEVWHMFSPDVPTSILLGMLFPMWMIITNPKYFIKSVEGRFSVICYIVGTLEFTFFKEAGAENAANFAWCMMAGMLVLFTFTISKLIKDTITNHSTKMSSSIGSKYLQNWQIIKTIISWFLLSLHVYSGIALLFDTVL